MTVQIVARNKKTGVGICGEGSTPKEANKAMIESAHRADISDFEYKDLGQGVATAFQENQTTTFIAAIVREESGEQVTVVENCDWIIAYKQKGSVYDSKS